MTQMIQITEMTFFSLYLSQHVLNYMVLTILTIILNPALVYLQIYACFLSRFAGLVSFYSYFRLSNNNIENLCLCLNLNNEKYVGYLIFIGILPLGRAQGFLYLLARDLFHIGIKKLDVVLLNLSCHLDGDNQPFAAVFLYFKVFHFFQFSVFG